VNASVLKTKLAMAIIGISSIHLLKTFINAASYEPEVMRRRPSSTSSSCCRPGHRLHRPHHHHTHNDSKH
jgi:uncharacterized membrane protein YqhA